MKNTKLPTNYDMSANADIEMRDAELSQVQEKNVSFGHRQPLFFADKKKPTSAFSESKPKLKKKLFIDSDEENEGSLKSDSPAPKMLSSSFDTQPCLNNKLNQYISTPKTRTVMNSTPFRKTALFCENAPTASTSAGHNSNRIDGIRLPHKKSGGSNESPFRMLDFEDLNLSSPQDNVTIGEISPITSISIFGNDGGNLNNRSSDKKHGQKLFTGDNFESATQTSSFKSFLVENIIKDVKKPKNKRFKGDQGSVLHMNNDENRIPSTRITCNPKALFSSDDEDRSQFVANPKVKIRCLEKIFEEGKEESVTSTPEARSPNLIMRWMKRDPSFGKFSHGVSPKRSSDSRSNCEGTPSSNFPTPSNSYSFKKAQDSVYTPSSFNTLIIPKENFPKFEDSHNNNYEEFDTKTPEMSNMPRFQGSLSPFEFKALKNEASLFSQQSCYSQSQAVGTQNITAFSQQAAQPYSQQYSQSVEEICLKSNTVLSRSNSVMLSSRYREDFEEGEKIGAGHFGTVYKCLHKLDNHDYAVKITKQRFKGERDKLEAMHEVFSLSALSVGDENPYIVRYYSGWIENSHLYLVMELCKSSLQKQALEVDSFSENQLRKIMRDVCLGLKSLHDKSIVHLDIKPENILVSASDKYKIGDLGLSRLCNINFDDDVPEGDSRYLAPELFNDDPNTTIPDLRKADIFSLGIMIYGLMAGKNLPKNGPEWHNLRNQRVNIDGLENYSTSFKKIVLKMMHPNPDSRPSSSELLEKHLLSEIEMELKLQKSQNDALKAKIEELERKLSMKGGRKISL